MNSYLIKRHCLIFFRDKSAVFFAILASVIVIGINLFLLSDVYSTSFVEAGFPLDQAMIFITSWTLCGALAINAVTVPLSFMGFVVADKQNDVIKDFRSSPMKPSSLNLSYVLSSFLVTLLIVSPILMGFLIYLVSKSALYIGVGEALMFVLLYSLGILLFSLIGLFLTKFIKTQSAHSGLIGVCSAFLGFLGAVYMPIGNFSGIMKLVISTNPLSMLGMVIKQTFMGGYIKEMKIPQELIDYFGVSLNVSGVEVTSSFVALILLGCCVCFFILNSVIKEK